MLKYLYLVTENLILAAIITGVLFSFMKMFYGRKGRNSQFIGCGVGLIAAGVMSYLKNTTKKFDMSLWNLRTLMVFFIGFVIFIIFTIGPLRKVTKKPGEYFNGACRLVNGVDMVLFFAGCDCISDEFRCIG